MSITVRQAQVGDAAEVSALAAATFPLACPASVVAEDIAAFIAEQLSEQRFAGYLADPDRIVLTANVNGTAIGYTMLVRESDGPELSKVVELSKMYVLPGHHGTGAAEALMRAGIAWASATGAERVWLGVNQKNEQAQRFYRRHGFETIGTRTFRLGASTENDFVMDRPL